MLTIKIHTGNAAYRNEDGTLNTLNNTQLQANLEQIAYELSHGFVMGKVRDINGNTTGEWKLTNR